MPAKKKGTRKPTRKASRRSRPKRPTRRKPETLRFRSVSPSFTVNDIERSLAWYRDVLGCTVQDRWERDGKLTGAIIKAGRVELYLGQDDWKLGRDRKKGEGFRIYCSTVQDIDKVAAGIKARGGTLLHEPQTEPWGERDFAVADPDGFKITVSRQR
jgi:uncharacterized glyoxalase superfamily protein PhnB